MYHINCTFYRPNKVNTTEFYNIIGKLHYDLYLLETNKFDEFNAYWYVHSLCKLAKPLDKNPRMAFLGLASPENMPSDARVEFFYLPTYIATAFMIKAVLLYPSFMDKSKFVDSDLDFTADTFRNTLASCMFGCTGRDFDGAGVIKIKDCIKLFEEAGTIEFIAKYPDICPEFTRLFTEMKSMVDSGKTTPSEAWFNSWSTNN